MNKRKLFIFLITVFGINLAMYMAVNWFKLDLSDMTLTED